MENNSGSVAMRDPFECMNLPQLLTMYGILERASGNILKKAYLFNWGYEEYGELQSDIDKLCIQAYRVLMERLASIDPVDEWIMSLPRKPEWDKDKHRVSD
jgi:hypothetical protein